MPDTNRQAGNRKPPVRRTDISHLTGCNAIASRLIGEYALGMTWDEIGAKRGVSGGMAFRVAVKGYEPRKPETRRKLGLPIYMPAPACPKCGGVHVTKRCTARQAETPKRPRRPSLSRLTRTIAGLWAAGWLRLETK